MVQSLFRHLRRQVINEKQCRLFNTLSSLHHFAENPVDKKICIISTSRDIFTNLAFEDFLYKSVQFVEGRGKILILWRDKPCLVIGRHQNPWTEVHVGRCRALNIPIARRNSGGGTVYHDDGNINLSFMTNRADYRRRDNLIFMSQVLKNKYSIDAEISPREDLILSSGNKISGTASKLGQKTAYHHCTLLVSANLSIIRNILRKDTPSVMKTNATTSVRSTVSNLNQVKQDMDVSHVITELAQDFIDTTGQEDIFQVDPSSDNILTELSKSIEDLTSWKWIYGRTPKFTLEKEFTNSDSFTVKMTVNHGLVTEFQVESEDRETLRLDLKEVQFEREAISEKLVLWSLLEDDLIWSSAVCRSVEQLLEEVI